MSHNRYLPNELASDAKLRVFAFPYAGGGAATYFRWRAAMPDGVDLIPVLLPGREGRVAEPPLGDMRTLVMQVADAVAPPADQPYALLGHSMGAWIAFELARELGRRGNPLPRVLIASSSPAPDRERAAESLHKLPDAEFVAEMIRRFDGIPAAVQANQQLLQLLLPAMRADMQLLETYNYEEEPPLSTDIIALGGTEDRVVTATALARWRRQTTQAFTSRLWPGGHFFLFHAAEQAPSQMPPPLRWIASRLERYLEK
jgi:medium-chain acyl-[acyl-carrier-protein] hydrolase